METALNDYTKISWIDEPTKTENQDFKGERISFTVDNTVTRKLQILTEKVGCTLFTTTLLAFSLLMSRYFSQEDMIIATPVAGRVYPDPEIENVVGCFINLLPIRLNSSINSGFITLLKETAKIISDTFSHQNIPFEKI